MITFILKQSLAFLEYSNWTFKVEFQITHDQNIADHTGFYKTSQLS